MVITRSSITGVERGRQSAADHELAPENAAGIFRGDGTGSQYGH